MTLAELVNQIDRELEQRIMNNQDVIILADAMRYGNIIITVQHGEVVGVHWDHGLRFDRGNARRTAVK